MDFINAKELLKICNTQNISISKAMQARELSTTALPQEEILAKMTRAYEIMKGSIAESLSTSRRSMGGLIGGEALKLKSFAKNSKSICGTPTSKAIMYAMGVLEVNASMGLVVAAPTGGSSGVIPGVFAAFQEEFGLEDEIMVQGLFNAAAIGYIITRNGSVSGAEAGCQAEVGSAAAMAAAAVTELAGGCPETCLNAASFALSNLMGLVCDPIGGLVEEPCQKRNAIGASNALICAEMALAGIKSIIPFDEMVECMLKVGASLPCELRETAMGGMAIAPSAPKFDYGI